MAATGSLAIKHAEVSSLLCGAVPRAQTASQGFPTICSSSRESSFKDLTLSFKYYNNAN